MYSKTHYSNTWLSKTYLSTVTTGNVYNSIILHMFNIGILSIEVRLGKHCLVDIWAHDLNVSMGIYYNGQSEI